MIKGKGYKYDVEGNAVSIIVQESNIAFATPPSISFSKEEGKCSVSTGGVVLAYEIE